jgi:8-oxo-dGTP pyrophosphatase MutT (NUDIX family)
MGEMEKKRLHEHNPGNISAVELLSRILSKRPESDVENPKRARAIIIDPAGTSLLLILREKFGQEPYAVFPGGGIEDRDSTALTCLRREIEEELSVNPEEIHFSADFIGFDNQWFFVGIASEKFEQLVLGGPEAASSVEESGTYHPRWVDLTELGEVNLLPKEIRQLIVEDSPDC